MITQANCCGRACRGAKLYIFIATKGKEAFSSQLSLICLCQGQTQQHCDNLVGESVKVHAHSEQEWIDEDLRTPPL